MSRTNSSKSQIFLMEFICVVMFFALCAALCINAFVKADQMSKEGSRLNEGLLVVQTVAETIKGMETLDEAQINRIVKEVNETNEEKYRVEVEDDFKRGILTAEISVYQVKNKEQKICSVSVKKYLPSEVQYAE